MRGSDALLLRVPRKGGVARVASYPNIDSTVWSAADAAPVLERILAFDPDAGLIAAADARGYPIWLDLRVGSVSIPGKGKLHDIESVDGSTIYGVGADGAVARFTPAGNWLYKPPAPAAAAFPQSGGTLIVLGGKGENARLWRLFPPENRIRDSISVPNAVRGIGAPLGDQIYVVSSDHKLTGVHARTMKAGRPIEFGHAIGDVATTPSGDRFYVLEDSTNAVQVVDRYQDRVTARVELPSRPRNLRVDPFGRFVLVRAATGDSVWVIAVGTDKVIGAVQSEWRGDVPFIAPDGTIGVIMGSDLVMVDGATLRARSRVFNGASEFWYPFVWNGLRPRNEVLDKPVEFPTDSDTLRRPPPPRAETTVARPAPAPVDSAKLGFTVSFAALLDEPRAREQASKINVNGQTARVVTSMMNGMTIYRVVLGPFPTRDEADRIGRASGVNYVVSAGAP
jgi:DNA-binding beta-propeller fold protein YncE